MAAPIGYKYSTDRNARIGATLRMKYASGERRAWNKGKHLSDEHKEKIRVGNIGIKKVMSNEGRMNISLAHIGKTHRGVPKSDECKQRLRDAALKWYETHQHPFLGKRHTLESRIKNGLRHMGKTAGSVNGNYSSGNYISEKKSERRNEMRQIKYREWRLAVFIRDDFTCMKCGTRGCYLNAHHIKPWSKHPELRYQVDNGATMCEPCHISVDENRNKNLRGDA